jgi:GT2 family glycosyltransferase
VQPAPDFSVVVAAFNSESTITSAIESVMIQTETSYEIIVVDDGSTDATAAVVAGIDDPRVRLLLQENGGTAAARNAGIVKARGRYVALLDADDLYLPHYLEFARAALERNARAGFAYTDAYPFEAGSGRVRRQTAMHWWPPRVPLTDPDVVLLELLRQNFIYGSVTFPHEVLDDVGLFDTRKRMHEDYDMWLRIVMRGYVPVRMQGLQALYRMHPGQKTKGVENSYRGVIELMSGLPIDRLPSDAHRVVVSERLQSAERQLRILNGEAPLAAALGQPRRLLSRLRLKSGLRESWYPETPAEIAAVFPDLKAV